MTLSEIIFDLLNIVRGGVQSSTELISDRQVAFWISNTRNLLIQRDYDKGRSISDNIIQDLGCIDVSKVDASACCGIKVNCNIVRTNVKIPNPIETSQRDLITRVGPISLVAPSYTFIPYHRAPWAGNGKYNQNSIFAFLHENYIYVMGKDTEKFKRINVQGVFEDPTKVSSFNTCAGKACYTNNSEYPISGKYIEILKEMILKTNFKLIVTSPTDISGDTKANPEPNK